MSDLIDRKEAVEVVKNEMLSWLEGDSHDYRKVVDAIMDVPTVEAVPVRHGKWLPKHHYIAGYEFVSGHICSECGNGALNAEGDYFLTDFCPNCGARMDEDEQKKHR